MAVGSEEAQADQQGSQEEAADIHPRRPPFEELGCFSGCLMSSAGIQKLFCGIYSTFKCSFDEFVGEKVFSPSYSSAILAPPPPM